MYSQPQQVGSVSSGATMMEVCSNICIGNWELVNTLGEGAYGEVKLAMHKQTGETRAMKIISLNLVSDRNAIQKEVLIHKSLNHENIIKFVESFPHMDTFCILLEYASGGELFDRIEPDYGMNVELAHKYFSDLINGVEYLHSKGIVHRDIKPENLLLNHADQIKIADFGLATLFQYRGTERLLNSPCGTAPYVAPEVLMKPEYKAQPTDIWSCGIVLVAMLAGELPWDKPVYECEDFVSWVKYNNYQKTPWCKIENTALSLLRNILTLEPSQRFTLRQVRSSSWFVKSYKQPAYEAAYSAYNGPFLSQPTYVFANQPQQQDPKMLANPSGIELEFTDSQQSCGECSMSGHMDHNSSNLGVNNPRILSNIQNNLPSFSQPISTEDMYLNTQVNQTQTATQQSQSPMLKLVKRLTRMFVHLDLNECVNELKVLFTKFKYDFRVLELNKQCQITVTTSDKRHTLLTFKVNVIEMTAGQNEVLVDFRLSKGDGLEFKKIFIKIKSSMAPVVCKRYVFTNNTNSHAGCNNSNNHCK